MSNLCIITLLILKKSFMKKIDGIKIAEKIDLETKEIIQNLGTVPKLVILYIGENFASEIYINKKIKKAESLGLKAEILHLQNPSTDDVLKTINNLNNDDSVTGYIIQLPVPSNINLFKVLATIDIKKDVDGLNPFNLGLLFHSNKALNISATALATIKCLQFVLDEDLENTDIKKLSKFLSGKKILIINNSILIGKPLNALLSNLKATLTIANKNTKTTYIKELIQTADIVITATGVPGLVKANDLRDRQIIIDIGIKRLNKHSVVGDVEFDEQKLKDKDIWITPVPNGIGPVTVSMLFNNLVKIANQM